MKIKKRGFEIIFTKTRDGWLATINDSFHTGCTGSVKSTKKEAALDTLEYFGECFDDTPFPYIDARKTIAEIED